MRSQAFFIHMRDISMNRTICSRHRLGDGYSGSHGLSQTNQTTSLLSGNDLSAPLSMRPPVDMVIRDGKVVITVEIPGVRKEDISLEVCGRSLIVNAKYREKGSRPGDEVYLEERQRRDICRYIFLPLRADPTRLEMARYKDGVLHIHVPEMIPGSLTNRAIPVRG